jgi:hypothetical protein
LPAAWARLFNNVYDSTHASRLGTSLVPYSINATRTSPKSKFISALPESVDGLPNICGSEPIVDQAIRQGQARNVFLADSGIDFGRIKSAAGPEP